MVQVFEDTYMNILKRSELRHIVMSFHPTASILFPRYLLEYVPNFDYPSPLLIRFLLAF